VASNSGRGKAGEPPRRRAPTGRPRAANRSSEPEGFDSLEVKQAPLGRPRPAPAGPPRTSLPSPAILTELLRGPLQLVGQMTGIETAARAMERLAVSADRAAEILDRISADRIDHLAEAAERAAEILELIDASRLDRLAASAERAAQLVNRLDNEVGVERVINVLERLERLSETADQMNRSLRAVERLALDVQKRVIEPLDRLPIARALREGLGGRSRTKPER
jgi:hypothetical protein